jgi:hypothetical protein
MSFFIRYVSTLNKNEISVMANISFFFEFLEKKYFFDNFDPPCTINQKFYLKFVLLKS